MAPVERLNRMVRRVAYTAHRADNSRAATVSPVSAFVTSTQRPLPRCNFIRAVGSQIEAMVASSTLATAKRRPSFSTRISPSFWTSSSNVSFLANDTSDIEPPRTPPIRPGTKSEWIKMKTAQRREINKDRGELFKWQAIERVLSPTFHK